MFGFLFCVALFLQFLEFDDEVRRPRRIGRRRSEIEDFVSIVMDNCFDSRIETRSIRPYNIWLTWRLEKAPN